MPERPHVAAGARQLSKTKRERRDKEAVHHRPEGDLTHEQAEALRRLETMGDGGIDTDAITPAPAEAWRHARRGPVTRANLDEMHRFFGPVKQPVSLRLDADIVHGFKERGRGWQIEITRALRVHMERKG